MSTTLAARFASNLRRFRKRQKWSQTELALRAGVGVSYVSMLERGQRSPPLATIERFAAALTKDPLAFLREESP